MPGTLLVEKRHFYSKRCLGRPDVRVWPHFGGRVAMLVKVVTPRGSVLTRPMSKASALTVASKRKKGVQRAP